MLLTVHFPVVQKYRSKGQIDREDGGRIDDFKNRRRHKEEERKADRRNANKQRRAAKRQQTTKNKRAVGNSPYIVGVVGLCSHPKHKERRIVAKIQFFITQPLHECLPVASTGNSR